MLNSYLTVDANNSGAVYVPKTVFSMMEKLWFN
jgi:hypothetical protein